MITPARILQAQATVQAAAEALQALDALDPEHRRPASWCLVRDFIGDVKAKAEGQIEVWTSADRKPPWAG